MPVLIAWAVEAAAVAVGATLTATTIAVISQVIFFAGVMVYGSMSARKARQDAKDRYNASLTDRTVTLLSADAPWQVIYGSAQVGGQIVATLTSGDKDQFKHVVVVWACHECEAITDTFLAGESIGPLDANGWVTTGKWRKDQTDLRTEYVDIDPSGAMNLPEDPARIVVIRRAGPHDGPVQADLLSLDQVVVSGRVLQVRPEYVAAWASTQVIISFDVSNGSAMLRVRHHLGRPDQVADPVLMAELPEDWKATDRLQGLCYSIFTFNLNEPQFQGGPPNPSVRILGKRVPDPRTGITQWSNNPALCTADFITAEYGKQALPSQVNTASVIAAANACDEGPLIARRFRCDGAFRTDEDPDVTLDRLCQSMAGFASFNGSWQIQAGVYTPPVMALTDADNMGSVELVAAPQGDEVFNGLRGKFYDPARFDQLTDYVPYKNAAFVAEDGRELWEDLHLPFTNSQERAHNLARIQVERSRGMQLVYPAKRRALRLKVGQRITLTLSALGIQDSIFRVVKREYRLGGPVMLHLAQDDPSYYDNVDATASLPPPTVHLPDPWRVAPVLGLQATSGTATLLRQDDGTVLSRVRVTYTGSVDGLVTAGGAMQLEYRRDVDATWLRAPEASGAGTETFLLGLEEGQMYLVRARWRNALGALSDWATTSVMHTGKTAPPGNVQGLTAQLVPAGVRLTWATNPEPDRAEIELHVESEWHEATAPLYKGGEAFFVWSWPPAGNYTVLAKYIDTSGNKSAQAVALKVEVMSNPGDAGGLPVVVVPKGAAPVVTIEIQQADYVLRWTAVQTAFPLADYQIRVGATLEASTQLDRTRALERRAAVDWTAKQTFWVAAVDIVGNVGAFGSASYAVPAPDAGAVEVDPSGNVLIRFKVYDDPQIVAYELREGADWATARYVDQSTGAPFKLPLTTVVGKQYWVKGRYGDTYTLNSTRISFQGTQLTAPSGLGWTVAEPNLAWQWNPVPGAAQYVVLWEDSGITTVRVVSDAHILVPIPRGNAVFRLIAVGRDGSLSAFVDEELSLVGQYSYNELVFATLDLGVAKAINLAITNANTVRRASVRGIDPEAPYVLNVNDGDLFAFGYNLANLPAAHLANVPSEWFRDGFWRVGTGYAESGVIDLGAVLTGRLSVGITKTVNYVGDTSVATYGHVLVEHLAEATVSELVDQRAFVSARLQVCTSLAGTWKDVNNGDWITARYVRFVVEVAMASPLTEIVITAGQVVLDVPDIVVSGKVDNVTTTVVNVPFPKPFNHVSSIVHSARGSAKSELMSSDLASFQIRTNSATPTTVDYFVKGY